jgi:murein DD-endopeptidase MepM/ murein hydrolase activator NlpD
LDLTQQTRPTYNLNRLQRGTPYSIQLAEDNRLVSFTYHVEPGRELVVEKVSDNFHARFAEISYRIETDILEGTVKDNLVTAIMDAGGSYKVALDLEEIFAWEINFFKDLRKGDSFKILVEKQFRGNTFAGFGKILAVEFTNQGNPLQAVLFTAKDQHGAYYTPEGQPLRKQFLKSPLRYTRITSKFTYSRYHPIYKEHLPHLGVDYAAPRGTPIRAIGEGQVLKKSRSGRSGKHIRLKHRNGYVSTYSHLSRYAKGLKKGDTVQQGEVIGYVGATGAATGPHLCFHMYKHRKPVNPLKFQSPKGKPLNAKTLKVFSEMARNRMATLNGETIHIRRAGTRHPTA